MALNHGVVEWRPAEYLKTTGEGRYALIVLNQPLENTELVSVIWPKAVMRIAADGGANRIMDAIGHGRLEADARPLKQVSQDPKNTNDTILDAIVGDLDSIKPEVRAWFVENGTTISEDPDQYSTDFTKALKFARANCPSPTDIIALGGLGGRADQGLATLNHLYKFQDSYEHGKVFLVSKEALIFVLRAGKHRIEVKDKWVPDLGKKGVLGRNIGIIPKAPCHISTMGLEWDVQNWRTEWGGNISTSNYVREEWVEVECDGDVLFTIDYQLTEASMREDGLE